MVDLILINDVERIIRNEVTPEYPYSMCFGGDEPYKDPDFYALARRVVSTVLEHTKRQEPPPAQEPTAKPPAI